jgi:protein tyrosine phosphatase type IVA
MSIITNTFTNINHNRLNLFISETPNNYNIVQFINELHSRGIKHVVRLCGKTYDPSPILDSTIIFHDLSYLNGTIPTKELLTKWNKIIKLNEPVLVHCISGLGRAPVLVTVSLIENKMNHDIAIRYIREKRPGSLNSKQREWLHNYKSPKINFLHLLTFQTPIFI